MDEALKKYWEDLDIPVGDFIEDLTKDEEEFRLRVFHRLKNEKALGWCTYLSKRNFSTDEEHYALLQTLSDNDILRIYCALDFAAKIPLPIIRKVSRKQGIKITSEQEIPCFSFGDELRKIQILLLYAL